MGYSDTDVAEYLYKKNPEIDSLVNSLCNDLTEACSTKPPPVPKDWIPGETFVPKSSKEAEMDMLLKSMEGKVLREGLKNDWRQKITQGIQDTSEVLGKHATNVSHRVRQWWKGNKSGLKKPRKAEL